MKLLHMVPQSNLKYINSHYYTLYNDLYYHKIVAIFGEDTINVIIKILPWLKPYIKSLDSFRYANRMIIAKRLELVDNLNKEDDHVAINDSTGSFRAITTSPDHVESIKQGYCNGKVYNGANEVEEGQDKQYTQLLTPLSTNNPLNVQYVKDSWKYIYSILRNKRLYAEYSDYQIDEPRNYVYNHFVEINRTYLLSYSKDVWLAPGQYNLNMGLAVKYGHGLGTTKFEIKYSIDDEEEEKKAAVQFDESVLGEGVEEDAEAELSEAEVEMDGIRASHVNNNNTTNRNAQNIGVIPASGSVNGGGVDRSVNGYMDQTVDATTNDHVSINNNTFHVSKNSTVTKLFYPPTNINDILPKNQFCFLRVAQFTIPPKDNQESKRNKLRKVTIRMEEIGLYLKSGFRIYFIDISQPSMLYDEYDLLYYSIRQTEYKYFINILLKNLYKALNYVQNGGDKLGGGKYGTGDPYDLWDQFDKSFLKDYCEEIVNDSNSASIIEEVARDTHHHKRSSSVLSGSVSATSSSSSLTSLHTPFKYDLKKLANYANFYFRNMTNTKRNYKFSTIYQQRQFINRFGDYSLDLIGQLNQPAQPLRDSTHAALPQENQVSNGKERPGVDANDDVRAWQVPESKCSYDKLGLKWKIPIVGEL